MQQATPMIRRSLCDIMERQQLFIINQMLAELHWLSKIIINRSYHLLLCGILG